MEGVEGVKRGERGDEVGHLPLQHSASRFEGAADAVHARLEEEVEARLYEDALGRREHELSARTVGYHNLRPYTLNPKP